MKKKKVILKLFLKINLRQNTYMRYISLSKKKHYLLCKIESKYCFRHGFQKLFSDYI